LRSPSQRAGIEIDPETPIVRDVVKGTATIDEAIFAITPTLHLLPSSPLNSRLDEAITAESANPGLTFVDLLRPIRSRYDYIIIDCAPALSISNQSILNAADLVLMPVTLDRFAQSGLENTVEEIKKVQRGYRRNEAGDVVRPINYRILFNKFDAREYVSMRYYSEISEQYKDHLFNTVIKTSADVKTAQAKKDDLFSYKKSPAREDFDALTKEILGWDMITNRKPQKVAEEV
jgi:chromosome partitioning protein